jgi:transposase
MKQSHVAEAIKYLSEHQTTSIPELHTYLDAKFDDYTITDDHLRRIIRDNNLTRKRTKHGHYPSVRRRQETDRKADLRAFYVKTTAHDINKIVSIDETSLTPFMYRPYSRCPLGDKCIERTDNNKVFTKHTFVAAITSSRIVGWKLYDEGAMNAERFVEFVKSIIERYNLRGYLFLFDNAGAHKGQGIRELIENTANTFAYTIPYNPQTNAIEAWFSQFKHYMESSRTRDIEGIRNECHEAIRKIQPQHYRNYFQYAYRKNTYPERERPRESSHKRPPKNYKVGGGAFARKST